MGIRPYARRPADRKEAGQAGPHEEGKVPDYAGDPEHTSAIEKRMKDLGREALYTKALARLAQKEKLPVEWATPEQRVRAALSVVRMRRKK